jgi:hypothetical protein
MNETCSLWGRKLDEYVNAYAIDTVRQRPTFDLDSEIDLLVDAREAIREISKLAGGGKVADPGGTLAVKVTLSMLESVLKLALYPHGFRHFACPSLINGCIKLMSLVKSSGSSSVRVPCGLIDYFVDSSQAL